MQLSNATLKDLPDGVKRPNYDRDALAPGIVHIGLGNFHRAHQAWYLHRLMQQGEALDWAIIGAGVRPNDELQRKRLKSQDYLATLIELDPAGRSAEVIGPMIDFAVVQEDNAPLITQLADPSIRIVSLTITEGGYYIEPVSNEFDSSHPDIQHDAANPTKPHTAFGAIVAALRIRRDADLGPFTIQSCDNLQGNGEIARQTIVSLAKLSDPALADWIENHCTFPNSMVDCIVPATGPKELQLVREFGIDDVAPVTHENFRQWVIEDKFCAGRPDWDKVGATFTDDVHPFEAMKIRLLNGGHQLLVNAGEILSVEYISGCMAHPLIGSFFKKVTLEEIAPYVHSVPNMTPVQYVDLIDRRFSNSEIIDTTRRVAFDGWSRHTGFLHPSIRDGLSAHSSINGLALSQALWARMCEGTREDGTIIEPNDPVWAKLNEAAKAAKENPLVWLNQPDLYGELAHNTVFAESFSSWLTLIWRDGAEAALAQYIGVQPDRLRSQI
jgi:mannitol 2-dehydrogenase